MPQKSHSRLRGIFYDSEPSLPTDPDSEYRYGSGRTRLPLKHLAYVFTGGSLGTLARYYVSGVTPVHSRVSWPVDILIINIAGAFVLAMFMEMLLGRDKDSGSVKNVRLFFGTGFLGSFTTYSSLAVGSLELGIDGNYASAGGYAISSVVFGILASILGIMFGKSLSGKRTRRGK